MQMLNPIDSARLHQNKKLVSVAQQQTAASTAYPSELKSQNGTVGF
jgi:hypothetical protein